MVAPGLSLTLPSHHIDRYFREHGSQTFSAAGGAPKGATSLGNASRKFRLSRRHPLSLRNHTTEGVVDDLVKPPLQHFISVTSSVSS